MKAFDNWEERLELKKEYKLVLSDKWYFDFEQTIPVKTYHLIISSDTLRVDQISFSDPCNAKNEFDKNLKYYQSEMPKYEMNNGPYTGLIQGANYFFIRAEAGKDSLFEKTVIDFEAALLKEKPARHSSFMRYTYEKAELK